MRDYEFNNDLNRDVIRKFDFRFKLLLFRLIMKFYLDYTVWILVLIIEKTSCDLALDFVSLF